LEVGVAGGQQTLVDVEEVTPAPRRPAAGSGVDKTFRPYDQSQAMLLPPSLDEWLPQGHVARFVDELVEHGLDLSAFYAAHGQARGAPPYDPRLMLKLTLYAMATGVTSSRAMERRCGDDVAFRWLTANSAPDHRSIARFRARHEDAITELFVQSVRLCDRAGMVGLGNVAVDGTKLRANASRHKAMSYDRMVKRQQQLDDEIAALRKRAREILDETGANDAADDARFGRDARGDELPDELARREQRIAKIRQARKDLEDEAAAAAAANAEREVRRRAAKRAEAGQDVDREQVDADAKAAAEQAAAEATPRPKAQRNFTDPESRIMKTADGSFHQCYNAQAAVDEDHQVIIAADVTNQAADAPHLADIIEQVNDNTGRQARRTLADAGYFSVDNVEHAKQAGTDAHIATGRFKHNETIPDAPRGRIPDDATPKQRMARKLRTKKGKKVYARRKAIVEPVFGQMATTQDAKRLRRRGLAAVEAEWKIHCAVHNFLKLFRVKGTIPATAG
jgi:transposase